MSETSVAAPEAAAAVQSYILFGVAGTTYAIRSQQVLHIEMIDHVTPVPNAPVFVEGVVFSRGQVVPVINLRARFGFDRVEADARTRLIIVELESRVVALLADSAREFVTIRPDSIQPPGTALAGLSGEYLEGIATIGDRLVLILNVKDIVNAANAPHIVRAHSAIMPSTSPVKCSPAASMDFTTCFSSSTHTAAGSASVE